MTHQEEALIQHGMARGGAFIWRSTMIRTLNSAQHDGKEALLGTACLDGKEP